MVTERLMTSSWLIIVGHMIYQNDKWVTSFRMMGDSSLWCHDSDYFRFTGNRKFIGFPVSIIYEHTIFLLILVVCFVFWYLQPFSRINYKLLDTYKKTDLCFRILSGWSACQSQDRYKNIKCVQNSRKMSSRTLFFKTSWQIIWWIALVWRLGFFFFCCESMAQQRNKRNPRSLSRSLCVSSLSPTRFVPSEWFWALVREKKKRAHTERTTKRATIYTYYSSLYFFFIFFKLQEKNRNLRS